MSRRTRRYMDRHFHRLEWQSPRRDPLTSWQEFGVCAVMAIVFSSLICWGVGYVPDVQPLDEGRSGFMSTNTAGGE